VTICNKIVLGSFWVVWTRLLMSLEPKYLSWQFLRYRCSDLACKGTSRVLLSHHWGSVLLVAHWQSCTLSHHSCQRAKLHARIKPTALCSAFDKENSIEFPLDFLHYLYNYYIVCALFSHAYHVTCHVTSCDIIWCDAVTSCHVTMTMWHLWRDTFPHFPLYSKSKIKEKKRKRKEI